MEKQIYVTPSVEEVKMDAAKVVCASGNANNEGFRETNFDW